LTTVIGKKKGTTKAVNRGKRSTAYSGEGDEGSDRYEQIAGGFWFAPGKENRETSPRGEKKRGGHATGGEYLTRKPSVFVD